VGRLGWLAALVVAVITHATAAQSHEFRSSDGVRLNYTPAGSGEVIVLVPGWTMPASIWAPQIEHLSKNYRVVAFDPRSQGDSATAAGGHNIGRRAQDIGELIDHLGVPRVVLAGWSLGVLEALAYVRAQGDSRIAALVLVDNSVGEDPAPKGGGNFLARLRSERIKTVTNFVREMFHSAPAQPYLDALTAQALKTPLDASIDLLTIKQPREYWRSAVYGTVKPVLYVVTSRLKGQADNLQRKRPATRAVVFETAGHALFVDEPQRFNALMDEFLGALPR
jgi:microsomal epoxide hydrolase